MSTNLDSITLDSKQSSQKSRKIQFSLWDTFKHHIPRFLLTILVDVILPVVIYFSLQKRIKPVYSLLVAGTPPLIMVIIKGFISRTFDALGFLVFIAFLISAIVAVITRNPIVLLLEKSIVTGILSIIFALTLLPLSTCRKWLHTKPLAYYFYQDLVPTKRHEVGLPENIFDNEFDCQNEHDENILSVRHLSPKEEVAKVYEWIYFHCSSFRRACYLITSIWSIGFLLEFIGRLILIFLRLKIEKIVIYGHVILTSATIIMILLTIICITKERKLTLNFIDKWNNDQVNVHE